MRKITKLTKNVAWSIEWIQSWCTIMSDHTHVSRLTLKKFNELGLALSHQPSTMDIMPLCAYQEVLSLKIIAPWSRFIFCMSTICSAVSAFRSFPLVYYIQVWSKTCFLLSHWSSADQAFCSWSFLVCFPLALPFFDGFNPFILLLFLCSIVLFIWHILFYSARCSRDMSPAKTTVASLDIV